MAEQEAADTAAGEAGSSSQMNQTVGGSSSSSSKNTTLMRNEAEGEGDTFRSSEIAFLQEQNSEVLHALENIESERDRTLRLVREWEDREQKMLVETEGVKEKVKVLKRSLDLEKTELIAKDEHVRVLSQQNQQMLELLEQEETRTKESKAKINDLEEANKTLRVLENEFDKIQTEIEQLVKQKKEESVELAGQCREFRQLNESLRADIASVEAQTQVDIEALNQVLTVVDNKNIEYMHLLGKQESREKQLAGETSALQDTCADLKKSIQNFKQQMLGDEDQRLTFERDKSSLQQKIESLESQVDVLKKTLNTAEKSNEQLQEENRRSAEKFREMADKVYGLMDSLRLNQVELKRIEAENQARGKKFNNTEKLVANLQSKIAMEMDAKAIAEQEKKDADGESVTLKKKNKKIEENIATAQNVQEQLGKHIIELNEQINALQTQNAYLASRIDGQEEEKNSLKAEIKKSGDRFSEFSKHNNVVRDEITNFETQISASRENLVNTKAELEYIKREDVLDDTGRQRPILIQSNESTLLEKLQVNEFLYDAQQNKNPVPSIVEKLAQLLELLHTSQGQCDQYLGDLSKSNSLVSALRQKNMILFEKTSMFESFKTRALVRYMMNVFESGDCDTMNLDGLNLTSREIQELINIIGRYQVAEKIYFISLAENGLKDDACNMVIQLIMQCPYLKTMDLRRNQLSAEAIKRINDQLRVMEGITSVIKTAEGSLNVHSGNQLRLVIECADQGSMAPGPDPTSEAALDKGYSVTAADEFLGGAAGVQKLGIEPSGMARGSDKLPNVRGSDRSGGRAKAKGIARAPIPPSLAEMIKQGNAGGNNTDGRMDRDPKRDRVIDKWQMGTFDPATDGDNYTGPASRMLEKQRAAASSQRQITDPYTRRPGKVMTNNYVRPGSGRSDSSYQTDGSSAMSEATSSAASSAMSNASSRRGQSNPYGVPIGQRNRTRR